MKTMRILFFFFIASLSLPFLESCISDEISDSPSDKLYFSTDTLRFDTIFTDVGSPTLRLKVFNRASKGLNISSIRMKDASGIFTMNVDGVSGIDFHDVEIRANDSIFIFVECRIDENSDMRPFLVEGEMQFLTNGVAQSVTLEAYGLNAERLRGATLERDVVLTAERPYIVFDTLRVAPGATLTILPGAQIYFHDKAMLQVDGTLHAVGEAGKMISMRGDRLGEVLPSTGYEILSGQWVGVRFGPESSGNRMEFVEMQSSAEGVVADSCASDTRLRLTLVNSWLHNSRGNVLRVESGNSQSFGCCFSDAGMAVVKLIGGEHRMVQCTLANYYLFAISPEAILTMEDVGTTGDDASGYPPMKASIENSIIYGITPPISPGNLDSSDVWLRNVLLGIEGSDDEHFVDCIWNENPEFETVRDKYYFNYCLKEDSPAIGKGNPEFVGPLCRYDMYGVDRLAAGNPALGAFAY